MFQLKTGHKNWFFGVYTGCFAVYQRRCPVLVLGIKDIKIHDLINGKIVPNHPQINLNSLKISV